MSFQTRKTSVHLQNTNQDIFDGIWQLSDPTIDSKGPSTTKVQKLSKEIGKINPCDIKGLTVILQRNENTLCENPPQKTTLFKFVSAAKP